MQSVIFFFFSKIATILVIWKHSDLETPSCLSSTVIRGGKSQHWRKISLSSVSELLKLWFPLDERPHHKSAFSAIYFLILTVNFLQQTHETDDYTLFWYSLYLLALTVTISTQDYIPYLKVRMHKRLRPGLSVIYFYEKYIYFNHIFFLKWLGNFKDSSVKFKYNPK